MERERVERTLHLQREENVLYKFFYGREEAPKEKVQPATHLPNPGKAGWTKLRARVVGIVLSYQQRGLDTHMIQHSSVEIDGGKK